MIIDVSKDFSTSPKGRYLNDGPYSGELFRLKYLEQALKENKIIELKLDGTLGYSSSFLEEAFGGLTRSGFSIEQIFNQIKLISKNPILIYQISCYIKNGNNKKN